MIGLDTNVLVRYIVQDDEAQALSAGRVIETECTASAPGFISLIVLAEIVWVLERAYGYERGQVAIAIGAILDAAQLALEHPAVARAALDRFRRGPADFADYLIGGLHAVYGCETTVTFDRRTMKSGLHRVIG
ncbi:MAG: type II toxin-antitoxin system VapC family toxin [Burkholderiales bacterium]|nr:type II toxin-antitoxin system VapC family toxin [Burkholderiales bacterium]